MEETILNSRLFEGIGQADIERLLMCAGGSRRRVPRGGVIYSAGDKVADIVLVIGGTISVCGYDYWGNRTLHAEVGAGDIFGAAYAAAPQLPVTVETQGGCEVLLLPYARLTSACGESCAAHGRLLKNIIDILARKNISQMEKMGHITKRTIREKLLSYLSAEAVKSGGKMFSVPWGRRGLADYLAVDRAALCRELSKLKREGILDYNKNSFRLLAGGDARAGK